MQKIIDNIKKYWPNYIKLVTEGLDFSDTVYEKFNLKEKA